MRQASAALLVVSRGEEPLVIVYATDAAADPRVKIAGVLPEDTHPPINYPAARPIFEKPGFTVLQ
jgi:molybdate transport system substrate-binding protein